MACVSLTAFLGQCGDSTLAGTKKVYMISYNDLDKVSGGTDVYTVSAGVVNAIGLETGKKFVPVKFSPNSESTTASMTRAENGVISGTAGFTGNILGFNKESGNFVQSLLGQEIVILEQLGNGSWTALGLDGGFYMNEATGTHSGSESGYAVTFGGAIYSFPAEVDKTLVPTLI